MNLFKPSARENDCSRIIVRSRRSEYLLRKLKEFPKLCALRVEESCLNYNYVCCVCFSRPTRPLIPSGASQPISIFLLSYKAKKRFSWASWAGAPSLLARFPRAPRSFLHPYYFHAHSCAYIIFMRLLRRLKIIIFSTIFDCQTQ